MTDPSGTVIGALVGAVVGGPLGSVLGGAAAGGLLGTAANPSAPLPLEAAMAQQLQGRALEFVSLRRESGQSARVVFRPVQSTSYFFVKAFVPPRQGQTRDQIDDALYDQLVLRLDEWVRTWRIER